MARQRDNFKLEDMPAFAGWRNCWYQIYAVGTAAGYRDPVVRGALHWHNGASHRALITSDGSLVLNLRPEYPRRDLEPLAEEVDLVQAVVSVTHRLTADEIATASRGAVHGSLVSANNACRVSHIVGGAADGAYHCMHYGSARGPGRVEAIAGDAVVSHVPALAAEYNHRVKRRCPAEYAIQLTSYLDRFFRRCQENDCRVRGMTDAARLTNGVKSEGAKASAPAAANLTALEKIASMFKDSLDRLDPPLADSQMNENS